MNLVNALLYDKQTIPEGYAPFPSVDSILLPQTLIILVISTDVKPPC